MSDIEQPSPETAVEGERRTEWETLAARYALGELDPECRHAVDTLVRVMPAFRRLLLDSEEALASVSSAAAAVSPAPELWTRLRQRLALPPGSLIRSDAQRWEPIRADGVEQCALHQDAASGLVTSLIRMKAGARIEPHWHSADEQCLVLRGSVAWGEQQLAAGDFVLAPGGSVLPEIRATEANLLLIIGPADGQPFREPRKFQPHGR